MNSANSAPTTARNTPSPIFAVGTAETPVPGNSPAAPSSSQGFDMSRWRDSHQAAMTPSPARSRMMMPTAVAL